MLDASREREPAEKISYEAPALTIIGPLNEFTFGASGNAEDHAGAKQHKGSG